MRRPIDINAVQNPASSILSPKNNEIVHSRGLAWKLRNQDIQPRCIHFI